MARYCRAYHKRHPAGGKFSWEIERKNPETDGGWDCIKVTVDFGISAYRPAVMYLHNGDPGYPEEGGEIEELHVLNEKNEEIWDDLTEEEQNKIKDECYDRADEYDPIVRDEG